MMNHEWLSGLDSSNDQVQASNELYCYHRMSDYSILA